MGDVRAGAERSPHAGDDDASDGGVRLGLVDGSPDRLVHLEGHAVQLVGPVEADPADPVLGSN